MWDSASDHIERRAEYLPARSYVGIQRQEAWGRFGLFHFSSSPVSGPLFFSRDDLANPAEQFALTESFGAGGDAFGIDFLVGSAVYWNSVCPFNDHLTEWSHLCANWLPMPHLDQQNFIYADGHGVLVAETELRLSDFSTEF
ncbi:MAG: hypothetical protein CMJ18_18380 [Phycisphaeraceae bacterium]|nr:hypothetical protein [Phycisphaeraceae bacterium]